MKTKIVAEIGCNHQGDLELAGRMIEVAAECGVDYIKFQKRNPKECLTPERYGESYHSEHSFGRTYGEHREKLEFTGRQHRWLFEKCLAFKVKYAVSVWDRTSLDVVIEETEPDYIKIPSAHNEDFELIGHAFRQTGKPLYISNGMSSPAIESEWKRLALYHNRHFVPYVCTSTYPCQMKDVMLEDISRFLFDGHGEIGFSGHHLGIALDAAAVALGATWVERHFTLDRSMKGRDQAASLEPGAMKKLVRDIRAVEAAMNERHDVLDVERPELERKMRTQLP